MKIFGTVFLIVVSSFVVDKATCDGGASAIAAIVAAGGQLLGQSGGGAGYTAVLPSGVRVDPDDCWRDGSGPCANGKN